MIKLINISTLVISLLVAEVTFAAELNNSKPVIILTDNIPPFTYQNTQGEYIGTADLVIHTLFNSINQPYTMESKPWKRALTEFENNEELLLFPITRTPARELKYQWLAAIYSTEFKLFGLKERFENQSVDITSGDYSFVCVRISIVCTALREMKIPESSITTISSVNAKQMIKMVNSGRVDFLILPEVEFSFAAKELKIATERFMTLEKHNYLFTDYLVAKTGNTNEVIKRLQEVANEKPEFPKN